MRNKNCLNAEQKLLKGDKKSKIWKPKNQLFCDLKAITSTIYVPLFIYVPFMAYVINFPSTFTHYLELSNFQFYFMIWIVVF